MDRFRSLVLVLALAWAPPIEAQESLAAATFATARNLYATAEYDRALAMLDGLLTAARARDERRSIELYRTLCLLAVGRTEDADRAIEGIVSADPMFRPSADDIPPRLRQAFSDTRRRVLPNVVQQRYAAAKTAFDREDYAAASDGFGRVLEALADPDLAAEAARPPLSDLRTLALGFHDLSEKLAVPPPELGFDDDERRALDVLAGSDRPLSTATLETYVELGAYPSTLHYHGYTESPLLEGGRVVVCPGDYVGREGGIYGSETVAFIRRYRADKAFVGAGGLSAEGIKQRLHRPRAKRQNPPRRQRIQEASGSARPVGRSTDPPPPPDHHDERTHPDRAHLQDAAGKAAACLRQPLRR